MTTTPICVWIRCISCVLVAPLAVSVTMGCETILMLPKWPAYPRACVDGMCTEKHGKLQP